MKQNIGRIMLGMAAISNGLFPIFDAFGTRHARSLEWHEHARFHNTLEALFFPLISGLALWLIIYHWDQELIHRIVLVLVAGPWVCFLIAELIIGPLLAIDTFPTVGKTFGIHNTALMVMGTLAFILVGYALDRRAIKHHQAEG